MTAFFVIMLAILFGLLIYDIVLQIQIRRLEQKIDALRRMELDDE